MNDAFSRYTTPSGRETQYQPGSGGRVLVNALGFYRKRDIDRAEFQALLEAQERYLGKIGPETRFTAALIRQMHRDWLGDIYPWAGEYRSVNVSKGGFHWPPAALVEVNMVKFERGAMAKHTPCPAGPVLDVAGHLAVVHAELLLIHPFREGNGRLARWVADLMAMQAGLAPPDYAFTGRGSRKQNRRYLKAVVAGYAMDYEPLTDFFRETLERRLADLA